MNFRDKKYTEEEIREYIKNNPEKLDREFRYDLSFRQNLSEDFIREFQDKFNWYILSKFQNLSEDLLIEFVEKVKISWLKTNKNIPEDVKERVINLKKVIETA